MSSEIARLQALTHLRPLRFAFCARAHHARGARSRHDADAVVVSDDEVARTNQCLAADDR